MRSPLRHLPNPLRRPPSPLRIVQFTDPDMPRASTRRLNCAYARASSAPYSTTGRGFTLEPKAKAAPRKKATPEEIADRKAIAVKKKVWTASLIEWKDPFKGGRPYQQVKGTMVSQALSSSIGY